MTLWLCERRADPPGGLGEPTYCASACAGPPRSTKWSWQSAGTGPGRAQPRLDRGVPAVQRHRRHLRRAACPARGGRANLCGMGRIERVETTAVECRPAGREMAGPNFLYEILLGSDEVPAVRAAEYDLARCEDPHDHPVSEVRLGDDPLREGSRRTSRRVRRAVRSRPGPRLPVPAGGAAVTPPTSSEPPVSRTGEGTGEDR